MNEKGKTLGCRQIEGPYGDYLTTLNYHLEENELDELQDSRLVQ